MGKMYTLNKYSHLDIDDASAKALAEIVNIVDEKEELTDEELDNMLENLAYIASCGYMKRVCSIYNNGSYNWGEMHKGIFGQARQYMQDKGIKNADDILLKIEDLGYLKDCTTDKVQKSEIYANIMYLSNVVAHILQNNEIKKNPCTIETLKREGLSITQAKEYMYKLKSKCIEKIIQSKENGENLKIYFERDKSGKNTFNVCIPKYFEPFSVHIVNIEIEQEIIEKYEIDKQKLENNYKTIFPFKVSEEKEELLNYIYSEVKNKNFSQAKIETRLEWYYNMQKEENNISEDRKLNNILKKLVDIAQSNGYIKEKCQEYNSAFFNDCNAFMMKKKRKNADDILLSENDFNYLEDISTEKVSKSEVLANIMFFSDMIENKLSQDTNQNNKLRIFDNKEDKEELIEQLHKVKILCINKLIEHRNDGDKIEIFLTENDKEKKVNVLIPNYFEPFSVKLLEKDKIKGYINKKENYDNFNTIIPFKVSNNKANAIQYIYVNAADPELKSDLLNRVKSRVKKYFETKKRLEVKKQKNKKVNKKKVKDTKKELPSGTEEIKKMTETREPNEEFMQNIIQEILYLREAVEQQKEEIKEMKIQQQKLLREKRELITIIKSEEKHKNENMKDDKEEYEEH